MDQRDNGGRESDRKRQKETREGYEIGHASMTRAIEQLSKNYRDAEKTKDYLKSFFFFCSFSSFLTLQSERYIFFFII